MNYEKLKEACQIYVLYLQDGHEELTEEELKSRTTLFLNRVLEGIEFPEIGKCDTQQKVDAATVFLINLSQKASVDIRDALKSHTSDPEKLNLLCIAWSCATSLIPWIQFYTDEMEAEFPKTVKYFNSHEKELCFTENNIIRYELSEAKGTLKKDDPKSWINKGIKRELECYTELVDIFQEESGYTDEEISDEDFMFMILEDICKDSEMPKEDKD